MGSIKKYSKTGTITDKWFFKHTAKWEDKLEEQKREYDRRYAEAETAEEILEVNAWNKEQTQKIDSWYFDAIIPQA